MPDDLTVITKNCSITMYDMKIELSRDGRERGLWFFIKDESEARAKSNIAWFEQNKDGGWYHFRVSDAVLLEWPAIEEFYRAMGKAIKAGKKAHNEYMKEMRQVWARMDRKKKTAKDRASSKDGSRKSTRQSKSQKTSKRTTTSSAKRRKR